MMALETMKKAGRGMAEYVGDFVLENAELGNILIGVESAYGFAYEASKSHAAASLAFMLIAFTAVGSATAIRYCKDKVG